MAESAPVGPMAPGGVGGASECGGGVASGGVVGAASEGGPALALPGSPEIAVAGECALTAGAKRIASRASKTSRASLLAKMLVSASVRAGRLQDVVTHSSLLLVRQKAHELLKSLDSQGMHSATDARAADSLEP